MNNNFYPENILCYCPRCGSNNFNILNEKAKKCDDCNFVFYVNPAAATAAIIRNKKGEVLFTRRAQNPSKGMLDLPGGFVDHNESVEDALIREIKEELNLEVKSLSYWKSFPNEYLYGGLIYYTVDMIYFCEVESFENISAFDDIDAYEFLTPSLDMVEQIGLPSIQQVVKQYIENEII